MVHPDELRGVVAAALGFGEDGIQGFLRQLGGAGEYPEVFGTATADECPLVVGVKQHHAVVRVERPEEGDAQHGGLVGGLGLAVGGLLLALLDAGVGHGNLAVLAQRVVGLAEVQPALEAMVETSNLVPVAEVSLQVQRRHGSIVNLLRIATPGKQNGANRS